MNLEPSPHFNRDLKRIQDMDLRRTISREIEELGAASSITEVSDLRPMTGWEDHCRIGLGDHRLGLKVSSDTVILLRFGLRRDFYRGFP